MAGRVRTVEDLVNEVRSLLDEDNISTVGDADDILPSLCRAQEVAANILTRHYESPLLKYISVSPVAGQSEYDIPEDALEERLEKIEVLASGIHYPLKRVSYREITDYETSQLNTSIPTHYCIVGRKYRLLPSSNVAYPLRVWYLEEPRPLVLPQGRITTINTADNYIFVDQVGTDLTTETDNLNSYVNLVDGSTGRIKTSLKISQINDTQIKFKSVFGPTDRSTVLNTAIGTTMSGLVDSSGTSVTIEPDDYVCTIHGSCIPFFRNPFSNYIVQYAVAELTRKLGGPSDMLENIKQELLVLVERSWVGREQSLRVSKQSSIWGMPSYRRYLNGRI